MYPSNLLPELALRRRSRRQQVLLIAGVSYFSGFATVLLVLSVLLGHY